MFSSPQQQVFPDEEEDDQQNRTSLLGFCLFCVELVGGSNKKQNWKGLGIAFIVIALVCLLILAAIFLTTNQPVIPHQEFIPITEHDIFHLKSPQPWNGTWLSDKSFSYLDTNRSIWVYHCDLLKSELIFQREVLQQKYIADGIVSPLANFVLIPVRKGHVRPFYTEYQYDLYEKSKKIASISTSTDEKVLISAITYSHSDYLFAFIHDFNIYVYNITRKSYTRVTSDGHRNTIHNGLVEWVYEYEIFQQKTLLFWSPNDRYLAYVKINSTQIPLSYYLRYDQSADGPEQYGLPYPKYQDPLPSLDVYIYHLKSGKTLRVPRPAPYEKLESNVYIYHVVWYCPTCLAIVYASRDQSSCLIQCYEIGPDRVAPKSSFTQETRNRWLVSRYLRPYFSSNGTYAYIIQFDPLASDRADVKGYPRVVRITLNQSHPQIDAHSPTNLHADAIIHVDSINQVYFTASESNHPLEKQLYRWKYSSNRSEIECLSCNDSCGYVHAKFSLGRGTYHIRECWGPSIPSAALHNRFKRLGVINDNEPFRVWMINRSMPYIEYFTVPLDKKQTLGHGMIILPPNYNPNVTIASYPVIVNINHRLYDRRVNKKFVFLLPEFVQVIEDNLGLVLFDAHGSLGQGETYLQDAFLQQYQDYLKLARHLKWNEKKFNETLNDTRFGLTAQGPAAIIALKLLEENPREKDEYRCAFLQSPVIDLSHYHAIFTERISDLNHPTLKLPQEWNLVNKSLAFAHGTADDVVHFKHSAILAKSLIESGVNYSFKLYPDADHYFDRNSKLFTDLYHYQRAFFRACLGGRVNKERKSTVPDDYD